MATSTRQFNVGLYREHLEEASFLYEQRLAYLHDQEIGWTNLDDWERRIEAHLAALVTGGGLAVLECRRAIDGGDSGEKHAALRVFCRHRRMSDALALLDTAEADDPGLASALAHALQADAPTEWRQELVQLFAADRPHLTAILADVIGFRRFACDERLLIDKLHSHAGAARAIARALGRVGTEASIPHLRGLLDADAPTAEAAAVALMRLGDPEVVEHAKQAASDHEWARRGLGLGGGPDSVRLLLELVARQPDPAGVLSLGLLGDLAAVMTLVDLLPHPEVGHAAAVALNTITGANLVGRSFVPDDTDRDAGPTADDAAHDAGAAGPGTWVDGPLRDREKWLSWLQDHRGTFRRGYRWRMGRLYAPDAIVYGLQGDASPYALRAASYDELVIRYRMDVPFEVELDVRSQRRFLNRIVQWVEIAAPPATPGLWYFASRTQA